jgi:VIT1/CCC1 family predicted Fe2+/Mn2+ transporter
VTDSKHISRRVLEPNDRISEVLFGLIMVLTFTGSLRIALADRNEIRAMLIGALGCNLAWGIIDAVFYLMSSLAEKSRNRVTLLAVRNAADPEQAQQLIRDALPPIVESLLRAVEVETIRQRLLQLPELPRRIRLGARDWRGALGVFLLVFLSTFPVAAPFVFMRNTALAVKVSNGIAILMLFFTGMAYGKSAGRAPWLFGIGMVVLGVILVGLTMALGG